MSKKIIILFSFTKSKTCNPPLYTLSFLYKETPHFFKTFGFLSPFGTKCTIYPLITKFGGIQDSVCLSVHHILSALLLLNCFVDFNQTLHKESTQYVDVDVQALYLAIQFCSEVPKGRSLNFQKKGDWGGYHFVNALTIPLVISSSSIFN